MSRQVIGSVLVRNEDVFVEQAIRNVARFCDRIYAVDHVSKDGTWEIVRSLAVELDHLDVRRSRNSAAAHGLLEQYAGTDTWVIGVDGDELYDPEGLARLRSDLLAGAHADVFRLKAHVLNSDELDAVAGTASGWLAPPSRPVTKLFNFGVVESWRSCPDPLQGGDIVFKQGFHWESRRDLAVDTTWQTDPLRCLHVCFLPRSTRERADAGSTRANLDESREFDRSPLGKLKRFVRRPSPPPRVAELNRLGKNWKREWYARGDRITVDAAPFLGAESVRQAAR
jgi:glycosyltransferase involved in cell wall biosynthesis